VGWRVAAVEYSFLFLFALDLSIYILGVFDPPPCAHDHFSFAFVCFVRSPFFLFSISDRLCLCLLFYVADDFHVPDLFIAMDPLWGKKGRGKPRKAAQCCRTQRV
jgi:hypothetical protein